jgi:hypothetical protein
MQHQSDIIVSSGGSVYQLHLESATARTWVDDHVHLEGWQWLGRTFAVEHRFAGPLIDGMLVDGLRVEVLR